ncbi:MAG TPA: HlyD family efflux transporter periplasmic adaptor subunit [Kofleriaceae bacterium]|nr:HlyD family efflux transporter periplasmic adaptor subunit [Kofleriaceae bacterium]
MPSDFRQTANAMRNDQGRARRALIAFAVLGVLLALLVTWAAVARVPLYAVSEFARLQARDEVHPVDTLVSGRVTEVNLPIGGQVHKGDVLLRLEPTDVGLRLEEARATERGLVAQTQALEAEIAAREEAVSTTSVLGKASLSEAEAARSESEAEATFASHERARASVAREAGVVAESEIDRANANMVQKQAAVAARERRLSVLSSETRRDLADRRAQTENLRRSLAGLAAERDKTSVLVKRLEVELERHTVRAPIDGLLGQVRAPQIGSVVGVGQTIAVVTPETAITLRADFAPQVAVGRILPGQHARMRVTGFPWTQYGVLTATVRAVSSEVADGRIRVELALDDDAAQPAVIPRRHGLIGEVEIELERVSPAELLARAAGQLFAHRAASAAPAPATEARNIPRSESP